MTVDELIDWLDSTKRQASEGGQDIGDFKVTIPYNSACEAPINDEGVNYIKKTVWFRSDPWVVCIVEEKTVVAVEEVLQCVRIENVINVERPTKTVNAEESNA